MKDNINILFIGLGSIGQRHIRNLKKILKNKVNFFAFRKKKRKILLNQLGEKITGSVEEKYSISVFHDLKKINNNEIDIVFITNPSSLHIKTILKLKMLKNKYIFIEKPLDSSLKKSTEFIKFVKKNKIQTFMGYNLRFNPCVEKAKEIISKKNNLGKILKSNFYYGDNLKNWHKYENYKISYAAKKNLGGGIVLSAIHEFDLMYALFGNAKFIQSYNDRLSDLDINVEDFSISIFKNFFKKHKFLSIVTLNFFQKNKERYFKIIFEKGEIYVDLIQYKISVLEKKKIKHYNFKKDNNAMYLNELIFFLNKFNHKKKISNDFNYINGMKSLNLALKVKSNKRNY